MFLKPTGFISPNFQQPPRAVVTGTGGTSQKVWTIEPGASTLVSRTTPSVASYSITSATSLFAPYWNGKYFFMAVTESTVFTSVPTVIMRSIDGVAWTIVHNFTTSGGIGRFSGDENYIHFGFGTTTSDQVDFVKSTDGGLTWAGTAIVSPHMYYHSGYPDGDLLMSPNDNTSGIQYFAKRSKVDQSITVRYPAAAAKSILSGHWCYFKARDSFFGDQGAGAAIYEINADLLSDSVSRKTAVNSIWGMHNSCKEGQAGTRFWAIDVAGSPSTWTYWYTENGTTWTNGGSWATGASINFPFYGSQSANRLGLASNNGNVRYTWDNGATFNTSSLGSSQACSICI